MKFKMVFLILLKVGCYFALTMRGGRLVKPANSIFTVNHAWLVTSQEPHQTYWLRTRCEESPFHVLKTDCYLLLLLLLFLVLQIIYVHWEEIYKSPRSWQSGHFYFLLCSYKFFKPSQWIRIIFIDVCIHMHSSFNIVLSFYSLFLFKLVFCH